MNMKNHRISQAVVILALLFHLDANGQATNDSRHHSKSRNESSGSQGISSIDPSVICKGCKLGITVLAAKTRTTSSAAEFTDKAGTFLCNTFKLNPEMCEGFLRQLLPIFHYVLKTRRTFLGDRICSMFLQGLSCTADDRDFYWNVWAGFSSVAEDPPYAPDILHPIAWGSNSENTPSIGHPLGPRVYEPGAEAVCGREICCRKSSVRAPGANGRAAGFFGDYGKCDLPYHSLENALEHISKEYSDVELIYWTGDNNPHDGSSSSVKEVLDIVLNVSSAIKFYFPNVVVIPVLGNHDTYPHSQFSPADVPEDISTSWVYESMSQYWTQWIPEEALSTFLKGGFFDVEVNPNFRVIVLNTNLCLTFNIWQLYQDKDPVGQLQWLVKTLEKSRKLGQKVHIVGHVAPNYLSCWFVWSKNFYSIISRYRGTVTAQFYGHTHQDEFSLLNDSKHKPVSTLWLAPSLTPYENNNPSYKVYYMDGSSSSERELSRSYYIMDHETWTYDLEEANKNPEQEPQWSRKYRATEYYGIANTLPSSMSKLLQKLEWNETEFSRYYKNYLPREGGDCDKNCRKSIVCAMKSPTFRDLEECSGGLLFSLQRRELEF